MPLVPEGSPLAEEALRDVLRSLADDLRELETTVGAPPGRVLDPASLRTASELLEAVRAVLDRPGPRTREALRLEVNLAYATTISVLDLVKSHTDAPRVPRKRPVTS